MSLPSRKVVLVQWLDAAVTPGWRTPDNVQGGQIAETVGFLIREDEHSITLAQSHADPDDNPACVGDMFSIPKGCILKKRVLKR